jgi:hypothetical protein
MNSKEDTTETYFLVSLVDLDGLKSSSDPLSCSLSSSLLESWLTFHSSELSCINNNKNVSATHKLKKKNTKKTTTNKQQTK